MGIWRESLQKEMVIKDKQSFVRVHSCWTIKRAFRWSLVKVHSCWTMKRKPSGGPWWGFIHMRIRRESLQKRVVLKGGWPLKRVVLKGGWPLISVSPSGRSFIRMVCHWGGLSAAPEVWLYLWIWSKMPQADTLVDGGRYHMVSRQHPRTWNKQVTQSRPSCIESYCPVCLPCCCCWTC